MLIESIYLRDGMFDRKIEFNPKVTLIHSDKNGCGKTTLLRFILYGLGYNIPSTKKINFSECYVELCLKIIYDERVVLTRNDNIIVFYSDSEQQTYVLPEQEYDLHARIYGTENRDILSNILGAFYMDQEKGWTLLNRGVVIGSIHFNIESLVCGLSGRDCSALNEKRTQLQRDKDKYSQIYSIAQYQDSLKRESGYVAPNSYKDETDAALSTLLIRQRQLKEELARIDSTLSSNNKFKQYVSDMKLLVKSPNGEIFRVTDSNIMGLNDSIDILKTKRKMISSEFAEVSSQIKQLEKNLYSEDDQLSFFEMASQAEVFDSNIIKIPVDEKAINDEMKRLDKAIKDTNNEISELISNNNNIVVEISDLIIKYGTELGIGDKNSISPNYLFTSNLKELSGALLHKTAFAFRLAYIKIIEEVLDINLPIILDSPHGKEVNQENINLMMGILKRDFSENQIIIASIYTYDFNDMEVIEIEDRLINHLCNYNN